MKLCALALCVASHASPSLASLVTFDDITQSPQAAVPSAYRGLSWFNFAVLNTQTNGSAGFAHAATSQDYVAFNNNAGPALVYSPNDGDFLFNGANFTAAYREGLVVHVSGYVDNVLTQQQELILGTSGPQRFDFNWWVDTVFFSAEGGASGVPVDSPYFAMDDFRFNETPEPGTLALLGVGLTGMLWSRRRHAR